jgi:carbamoyltransferase
VLIRGHVARPVLNNRKEVVTVLILGFNGGRKSIMEEDLAPARHDAAAVLLVDGEVVAAIEEERLDRLKHSNCFPENAIGYCLRTAGATLDEVDIVATNSAVHRVVRRAKADYLWDPCAPLELDPARYISAPFQRAFGVDVSRKVRFCPHHLAHAVSAFVPSGFEDALILAIDGDGDGISGAVLLGRRDGVELLREFSYQQSLGHLYTEAISILGYGMFDEYKVMGLAPYGDPNIYSSLFDRCYRLMDNGDYYLAPLPQWIAEFDSAGLISQARRKGQAFTQIHMDFAAALQAAIERIMLHVVRFYRDATGQKNLCLAGGVAHNCTVNGRILSSRLFDRLFVQPAAHDAGGALGAALQAWCEERSHYAAQTQRHVYWGTSISDEVDIQQALDRWKPFLVSEVADDVAAATAHLLANDFVIGWVQERSEFGPRALGSRSILADPRPARNKQRINAMIKKREGYRPFAPSVMEEFLHEYFIVPGEQTSFPFMNFVLQVREDKRQLLGAITHVDGSARIQTVSKTTNHLYWCLIDEFRNITGVPMVLNTSFNNNAEPIADSVEDAICCFLTTGLDYLILGKHIVSKSAETLDFHSILKCIPGVTPGYKLVQRVAGLNNGAWLSAQHQAESTRNGRFRTAAVELSPTAFAILQSCNCQSTLEDLIRLAGLSHEECLSLIPEILRLWGERVIVLRTLPAPANKASLPRTPIAHRSTACVDPSCRHSALNLPDI